jgi:hypothetical protein
LKALSASALNNRAKKHFWYNYKMWGNELKPTPQDERVRSVGLLRHTYFWDRYDPQRSPRGDGDQPG